MTSARAILLCAAALAAFAPLRVSGHSSDFILAKVTPQPGGVQLEMTADYGDNPMVASETEARAVLGDLLRVRVGAKTDALSALAPLRFEKRAQIDPGAPIPHDSAADAERHRYLCAEWSWKCAAEKIALELPDSARQSVILWTPSGGTHEQPRWVFMVGGDVSPPIAIPQRRPSHFLIVSGSLGVIGIAITIGWKFRRTFHPARARCC